MPTISVVIPTWRRPAALERALLSLQTQKLSRFEIIVVDNDADPVVADRVHAFNRAARVPALYIAERELGLHNARHSGVRAASTDLLVFTDDDATFDPCWLQSYEDAFARTPEMVAASGPTRVVWERQPPEWLSIYVEHSLASNGMCGELSLLDLGDKFRLSHREILFGVNMAVRKPILVELGGFNPDSFGQSWLGDGETGLNRKISKQRMPIGYVPDAVVYHHIPASRMTAEYFVHRMRNQGAADAYSRFRGGDIQPLRAMAYAAIIAIACAPLWAAAGLTQGATSQFALRLRLAAAVWFGRFRFATRLSREARLRELVGRTDWLA